MAYKYNLNIKIQILLLSITISPVLGSQEYKPENKRKAEDLANSVIKKQKTEEGVKSTDNSKQIEEIKDLDAIQKCALVKKCKEMPFYYLYFVTDVQDLQNLIAKYAEEYEFYARLSENGGQDCSYGLAFSPCGNYIASSGRLNVDPSIQIFNIYTKKFIANFMSSKYGEEVFIPLGYSPCGKYLVSGSCISTKIWDLKEKACIADLKHKIKGRPSSVNFSPCGKYLASGSTSGIRLYKIKEFILKPLEYTYEELQSFKHFYFHAGEIKVWDIKETEHIKDLNDFQAIFILFSPCGNYLAVSSNDEIKIFNLKDSNCLASLKAGYNYLINTIAFSQCNKYLACGHGSFEFRNNNYINCIIKIWDIEKALCIKELKGHNFPVRSVVFAPCGNYLASGSGSDALVKLWDIKEERCIADIEKIADSSDNNHNNVNTVAYSPCGNYLVSTYMRGGVKIVKRKYWQLLGYCAYCCKTKSIGDCSRCHQIYYCSTECQHLDWPRHSQLCLPS